MTLSNDARVLAAAVAAGCLATVVAFAGGTANGPSSNGPASNGPSSNAPSRETQDLVFVTEDLAVVRPGCDAVSVASATGGAVLHRGATMVSPGRLAATSGLTLVLAARSNGIAIPPDWTAPDMHDVYGSRATGQDPGMREETYLDMSPPVVPLGGIAVTRDDRYLLVATESYDHPRYCGSAAPYPDYHLSKVDLSTLDWDSHLLGSTAISTSLRGTAAEILISPDGEVAHVIEVPGDDRGTELLPRLRSFRVSDLSEVGSPVDLAPIGELPIDCRQPLHWPDRLTHATLTGDGRLVVNTWREGKLNVVDLRSRTAYLVDVPGLGKTAGVAVNHAATNADLLAVHGVDAIGIFRWRDELTLEPVARAEVEPFVKIVDGRWRGYTSPAAGPAGSIAWSTDGDHLIAAETYTGTHEFSVWDVGDGGRSLTRRADVEVCEDTELNAANDILTGNAMMPIAEPSATPTRTPTPRPVFRLFVPAVSHEPDIPALSPSPY